MQTSSQYQQNTQHTKQGFVFTKHFKKLFREPGPIRSNDAFSQNVPIGYSGYVMNGVGGGPTPNASVVPYPVNFQQGFQTPNGQRIPIELAGVPGDPIKSEFPIRVTYPDRLSQTFPARISLDQRHQYPDSQTFNESEKHQPSQKSWAKRVFKPFARMKKQKTLPPLFSQDSGVFYTDHEPQEELSQFLDDDHSPYPPYPPKKPSPKRKPLPPRGASLDSQLQNRFASLTPTEIVRASGHHTPKESSLRYSSDDVRNVPQAVYMRSGISSGNHAFMESGKPRQSALGLIFRNSQPIPISQGASKRQSEIFNVNQRREEEREPTTAQWSSTTLSQAEIDRFPIYQLGGNFHQIQQKSPAANNVRETLQHPFYQYVDVDEQQSNSNQSEVNECLAKAYANKKFQDWIARTPDVKQYPNAAGCTQSNPLTRQVSVHHQPQSNKPLTRNVSVHQPKMVEREANLHFGKVQLEDKPMVKQIDDSPPLGKMFEKQSSSTPVDPFELELRLTDLMESRRNSAGLQRSSFQNKMKKSQTSMGRGLAAKLMSETPSKADIRQISYGQQEKGLSPEMNHPKKVDTTTSTMEATLIENKEKQKAKEASPRPDYEEKSCSPLALDIFQKSSQPTVSPAAALASSDAHGQLQQPRHWRSNEVIFQGSQVEKQPFVFHRKVETKKEADAAPAIVEDVVVSEEELELLSRVQTWRSCVAVTPKKNLYAPSASATDPSTTTGMRNLHTSNNDRASEWTSISRRAKDREDEEKPKITEENSDPKVDSKPPPTQDVQPIKPNPPPNVNLSPGTAHISFQGPPSELVKFFKGSMSLQNEQQQKQQTESHEDLIDLNSPLGSQVPKKIQFGTKHIRQMSEHDSKRFFDIVGDTLNVKSEKDEKEAEFLAVATKKESKPKKKKDEQQQHQQSQSQSITYSEAKVWEVLHKVDKNGVTGIERLLEAHVDSFKEYLRGKNAQTLTQINVRKSSPKRYNHSNTKQQNTMTSTSTMKRHDKHDDEKNEHIQQQTDNDNEAMEKNVGDETGESVLLQNILDYVQGAGDISQLHNTLINMHKDLLERTTDPIERKNIDQRLTNLEKAVFVPT